MATSGSLTTTAYSLSKGTRSLKLTWERTSYSAVNNTSTISYKLFGAGTHPGWVACRNVKLKINGVTVYTKGQDDYIKLYQDTVIKSGTITIKHNEDGSKSFTASVEAAIYQSAVNSKGSSTFTLNTIARVSSVKATNCTIGGTTTITITRYNSDFTHILFLDTDGDNIRKYVGSATTISIETPGNYNYRVPTDGTSTTIKVACETYNAGKLIGTSTCSFVASINEDSFRPVISNVYWMDVNPVSLEHTNSPNILIRGVSQASVNFTVTSQYGATIKDIIVTNDDTDYIVDKPTTGTNNVCVDVVTSGVFEIVVTDSRNISTTQKVNIRENFVSYVKPTISGEVKRTAQTSNDVKATITGYYSASGGAYVSNAFYNQIYLEYQVVDSETEEWQTLTPTVDKGAYSFDDILNYVFDYRDEYTINIRVRDYYSEVTKTFTIIKGIPIFDWGREDFNFNVPLYFQGKPIDFVVEQGTDGMWEYRKWYSGLAECWGSYSTTKAITSSWEGLYYVKANSRITYPLAFTDRPNETVTARAKSYAVWCFSQSSGLNTKTSTGIYCICRPAAVTSEIELYLDFYVAGKWK